MKWFTAPTNSWNFFNMLPLEKESMNQRGLRVETVPCYFSGGENQEWSSQRDLSYDQGTVPGAWIIFHSSDASLPKNLVMVVSPPEPQKYGKITLMGNFRKIILTWWISCWILTIHIAEGVCMTMIIFNSASTLFLSSPYWTSFNARLPNLVQNNLFWGKTCQHCSLWFYIDLFLCWIINANHACLQKTFKNNHTHT